MKKTSTIVVLASAIGMCSITAHATEYKMNAKLVENEKVISSSSKNVSTDKSDVINFQYNYSNLMSLAGPIITGDFISLGVTHNDKLNKNYLIVFRKNQKLINMQTFTASPDLDEVSDTSDMNNTDNEANSQDNTSQESPDLMSVTVPSYDVMEERNSIKLTDEKTQTIEQKLTLLDDKHRKHKVTLIVDIAEK